MEPVGGLRLNPGFGCLGLWLALGCSPLELRISVLSCTLEGVDK